MWILIVVLLNYSTVLPLSSGGRHDPNAALISVCCQFSLNPADHPLRALSLTHLSGRRTVRVYLSRCQAFNHTNIRGSSSETVAYRGGGFGCSNTSPPKFRRPAKIVSKSTRLWKLLKIAEFRTPTHQDVRQKKGSKILKPPRFAIVLH
jgi:hypothetical protein